LSLFGSWLVPQRKMPIEQTSYPRRRNVTTAFHR
jgi:hypothetical protein